MRGRYKGFLSAEAVSGRGAGKAVHGTARGRPAVVFGRCKVCGNGRCSCVWLESVLSGRADIFRRSESSLGNGWTSGGGSGTFGGGETAGSLAFSSSSMRSFGFGRVSSTRGSASSKNPSTSLRVKRLLALFSRQPATQSCSLRDYTLGSGLGLSETMLMPSEIKFSPMNGEVWQASV